MKSSWTGSDCIFLSHPLGPSVPVYGNVDARVGMEVVKSMGRGDQANVYRLTLENHWGTHVDTPAHFFNHGPDLCAYPASEWIFHHPVLISLPMAAGAFIGVDLLRPHNLDGCDLLLIQTGFQRFRGQEVYSHDNPGVDAQVGFWLRQEHPSVKAIGFDFVSLTPRRNREEGRKSHRAFLDPDALGSPIRIIEDMDLDHPLASLKKVILAPLMVRGIDSAPCTVLGFV